MLGKSVIFSCPRDDIIFIKPLYKVTNLLGLTPLSSFPISTPKKLDSKIYASGIFSVFLIGTIYSLVNRHKIYDDKFIKTYIVLDFANDIILFASITAGILYGCVFKKDQWVILNQNIEIIDKVLNGFKTYFNYNPAIYASFGRVAFFTLIRCYVNYIWCPHLGFPTCMQTYAFYNVLRIYEAVLIELVINLIRTFKCRYKKLNNRLQNVELKNLLEEIQITGTISRRLIETVKCFNAFFGWTLLFTLGHEVVQLLECLNYPISVISLHDKEFGAQIIIENSLQGIYTLVICDFKY